MPIHSDATAPRSPGSLREGEQCVAEAGLSRSEALVRSVGRNLQDVAHESPAGAAQSLEHGGGFEQPVGGCDHSGGVGRVWIPANVLCRPG